MSAAEHPAREEISPAALQPAPKSVIELSPVLAALAVVLAVATLLLSLRLLTCLTTPLGLTAMLGLAYANGANAVSNRSVSPRTC